VELDRRAVQTRLDQRSPAVDLDVELSAGGGFAQFHCRLQKLNGPSDSHGDSPRRSASAAPTALGAGREGPLCAAIAASVAAALTGPWAGREGGRNSSTKRVEKLPRAKRSPATTSRRNAAVCSTPLNMNSSSAAAILCRACSRSWPYAISLASR